MARPKKDKSEESKKEPKKSTATKVKKPRLYRTKFPAPLTDDGRFYGERTEDYVNPIFRNCIPEAEPKKSTKNKKKYVYHTDGSTRTLLPLALQEDDEVILGGTAQRISGLSQARFNALVAAYRLGLPKSTACSFAGISPNTLSTWMRKANDGVYPYTALHAALSQAEAELEAELLGSIVTAGTKRLRYIETVTEETVDSNGKTVAKTKEVEKVIHPNWNAAAWALERRNPAYRLNAVDQGDSSTNTGEEDLLMMDGTTKGEAQEIVKDEPEDTPQTD